MIAWLILALLTIGTLAGLLWPLLHASKPPPSRLEHDLAVYKDQLAELDREVARGLLSGPELAAARVEIERRILAADAAAKPAAVRTAAPHWVTAAGLIVALPMAAFGLYLLVGSPGLPDRPLYARQDDPDVKMTRLADQLTQRLALAPDKAGFAMLGRALDDLARYGEAEDAYHKAVSLGDDSAVTWSALGQTTVLANGGGVVPEARTDFLQALKRDPSDARSRFFIGLAEAQIGQAMKALAIWRDLQKDSAPDSPWTPILADNIARIARSTGVDPASVAPDRSDITRQLQELDGKSKS